jgi:hypothetical protein
MVGPFPEGNRDHRRRNRALQQRVSTFGPTRDLALEHLDRIRDDWGAKLATDGVGKWRFAALVADTS